MHSFYIYFVRELLLSSVYDKLSSVDLTREVFLESLQSYIEEDRSALDDFIFCFEHSNIDFFIVLTLYFRLVSLTPIVMKDFVGKYQNFV